jgi:hypothetical protein
VFPDVAFSVLAGVVMREVEYQEKIVARLEKRPFCRWCY